MEGLGLTGRDDVTLILRTGFPRVWASNERNLRWKRHLFLMLGDSLGATDLRPPKCDRCADFDHCFGDGQP